MHLSKKLSLTIVQTAVVLSVGLASMAFARSLTVVTTNATLLNWHGRECIDKECATFKLSQQSIEELIPVPSTGTATLRATFMNSNVPAPVDCSQTFSVTGSSNAFVTVQESSDTYTCHIAIP